MNDAPRTAEYSEVSSLGIDGLDNILCGGLTPNRLYLVEGVPGSGKTTLAMQYLLEGARRGEPVLYVTLSETEDQVKNPELDEELVTRLLGEQTAQILRSAREAAKDMRSRAEDEVSTSLRNAHEATTKMREEAAFASAAQSLRQALQDMPELAELSKNIIIDQTPEGLRIQLVDQEGRSLFNEGSTQPNDRAKLLLRAVSKVIKQLPNRISISGHTSASLNGAKADTDWGLSSARADASRRSACTPPWTMPKTACPAGACSPCQSRHRCSQRWVRSIERFVYS